MRESDTAGNLQTEILPLNPAPALPFSYHVPLDKLASFLEDLVPRQKQEVSTPRLPLILRSL